MKKKAIITIKSSTLEDDNEGVEVVSVGTFSYDNDQYKINYEESELSGMEGTNTIVEINSDSFSLIRKGTTETNMNFKNNKEDVIIYKTPYGIINMKIFTKKVEMDIDENGGKIKAIYLLNLEEEQTVTTSLNINIKVQN